MITLLRFIIFVIPISLISFLYFFINDNDYYPGADFRVSDMPAFELNSLYENSVVNNLDLEESYLINVWASWCITCRIEHGFLVQLNSQNIPIIGLNYKDERSDAIEWLGKYKDPYRLIIHDYSGSLALDLGVTGAPETFLIKNGKIIAHFSGEVNKRVWGDVFAPVIKKEKVVWNDQI
jgi:cytochrome c biogenesis protein CcmG/thiol:disulfide interchange protein DsbE